MNRPLLALAAGSLLFVGWGACSWMRGVDRALEEGRATALLLSGAVRQLQGVESLGLTSLTALRGSYAGAMTASWYGQKHRGRLTASGEPFNPSAFTAAHRTLPLGAVLLVEFAGKHVLVRVNDRGPAVWTGHDLDLTERAADFLGFREAGVARVTVRRLQ